MSQRRNRRTWTQKRKSRTARQRRALRIEALEDRRLLAVIGNNLEIGDEIRNYRIAIATTAEFTAARGGAADALASVQSLVNDLNDIFEKELAVHFDLVPNNASIIFTDTTTDGYSDSNDVNLLINENKSVLDSAIGNANYDVGFVLGDASSGGRGLATLGSAGVDAIKARGAAATTDPTSDGWVTLVGTKSGTSSTLNTPLTRSPARTAAANAPTTMPTNRAAVVRS